MHTLRTDAVTHAGWMVPPWAAITQATAGPMPDLSAVPWGAITAPGMLLVAVWLVLTGRFVPRAVLDDALRREREWQEQAEAWREAHGTSEKSRGLLLDVNARTTTALERLAGSKDLAVSLLRSVRREATGSGDEQEEAR